MRFPSIAATLAISACALLVVPNTNSDLVPTTTPEALSASTQTIRLECPGCLVDTAQTDGSKVNTNVTSHLEMTFEVDEKAPARLLVNGFEAYPHADMSKSLKAVHVLDTPIRDGMMLDSSKSLPSIEVLGFTLLSTVTAAYHGEDVSVDVHITKVGAVEVKTVPRVRVDLVKDHYGKMAITQIGTSATKGVPAHLNSVKEDPNCYSWMCRWLGSPWRPRCVLQLKHKKDNPHYYHDTTKTRKEHHDNDKTGNSVASETPGSHRTWRQLVRSINSHVVLPIVMVLFSMSVIGLVVGGFIFAMHPWLMPSCRPGVDGEPSADEEKECLMQHQEPPPSYEEGPGGEEIADDKV